MPTSAFYPSPRSLTHWVAPITFDECREKYKEHVVLEKRDGVVLVRMHTAGGPCKFSLEWHAAMPMLWRDLGADPTNEVLILTGTGDSWMADVDLGSTTTFELLRDSYDHYTHDATMLLEGYLYNIDIPTITAFNGPGMHTEIGFLSDIVICADHASFLDGHFPANMAPGDGQTYVFMKRLGITKAALMAYTGQALNARTALQLGLVAEVWPKDKLLGRAWELAELIMKRPRSVRRFTHMIVSRPWKQLLHEHLGYGIGHELMGIYLDRTADDTPEQRFRTLLPEREG